MDVAMQKDLHRLRTELFDTPSFFSSSRDDDQTEENQYKYVRMPRNSVKRSILHARWPKGVKQDANNPEYLFKHYLPRGEKIAKYAEELNPIADTEMQELNKKINEAAKIKFAEPKKEEEVNARDMENMLDIQDREMRSIGSSTESVCAELENLFLRSPNKSDYKEQIAEGRRAPTTDVIRFYNVKEFEKKQHRSLTSLGFYHSSQRIEAHKLNRELVGQKFGGRDDASHEIRVPVPTIMGSFIPQAAEKMQVAESNFTSKSMSTDKLIFKPIKEERRAYSTPLENIYDNFSFYYFEEED